MSKSLNLAFCQRVSLAYKGLRDEHVETVPLALSQLGSVSNVRVELKKDRVSFRYDASAIRLQACLDVLEALDIRPRSDSIWHRWRIAAARQLDTNIKANAEHAPHCCGKPPSGRR